MRLEQVLVGILGVALALVMANAAFSQGTNTVITHPENACQDPYHVSGAGWDMCWQQDDARAQGLEINRAFFQGESVVWKMGVPFSLTKYDRLFAPGPFKDVLGDPSFPARGFGNGSMTIEESDCPRYHTQGELVNDDRICIEHRDGPTEKVSLWARYDLFNYRFLQGWHFDDRGVVEPFLYLGGHLIDGQYAGEEGVDHHHHAYWRVDFDIASEDGDTFQTFKRIPGERVATPAVGVDNAIEVPSQGECEGGEDYACAFWSDINQEAQLLYNKETHDKWRVVNPQALNDLDRPKSFEFLVQSDGPANHYSTFDAMVLERQGDSEEIGHEVARSGHGGDAMLKTHMTPPEEVTDPVVWLVNHAYHGTRDEDRGSMVYHDLGFKMQPRNFVSENPSESTFP